MDESEAAKIVKLIEGTNERIDRLFDEIWARWEFERKLMDARFRAVGENGTRPGGGRGSQRRETTALRSIMAIDNDNAAARYKRANPPPSTARPHGAAF